MDGIGGLPGLGAASARMLAAIDIDPRAALARRDGRCPRPGLRRAIVGQFRERARDDALEPSLAPDARAEGDRPGAEALAR